MARLSEDSILAVLPSGVNREEIVAGIPQKVWDEGFGFQSYSPLTDAAVSIPFFKVWVDIRGVPLELHSEAHMARAVSAFGIYLGSMEPTILGDCRIWSIFLATDDLAQLPYQIEIKVGGMVYTAQVVPRKWIKGQVYHRSELPPTTVTYRPPPPPQDQADTTNATVVDPRWLQDADIIRTSLATLREIFRKFHPSELPSDLAACLAGDRQAIEANHNAFRNLQAETGQGRLSEQGQPIRTTPRAATPDPSLNVLVHTPSHHPTLGHTQPILGLSQSTSHASPQETTPTDQLPTVHRTLSPAPRGKRTQPDLALQVCTDSSFRSFHQMGNCWEPHVLFPEISTPLSHDNQSVPKGVKPIPRRNRKGKQPMSQPLRRTSRITNNKNKRGQDGTVNPDINAFIDIPLQPAEGMDILALIGSTNIPIPSHLFSPSQQPVQSFEMGQSSKAQHKKIKQSALAIQGPAQQVQQANSVIETDAVPAGLLDPNQTVEQASQLVQCAQDEPGELTTADATPLPDNDAPVNDLDENEDDPYLDRVDYSDGEMSL